MGGDLAFRTALSGGAVYLVVAAWTASRTPPEGEGGVLPTLGRALVAAVAGYVGLGVPVAWWAPVAPGVAVMFSEWALRKPSTAGWVATHVVALGAIWGAGEAAQFVVGDAASLWAGWWAVALALAGGGAATVWLGADLVGIVMAPYYEELREHPPAILTDAEPPAADRAGGPSPEEVVDGFKDGGRLIGQLERLLAFAFILAGAPSAIGFLVAAKSLFRFGEIKDSSSRKVAEYVIIGTLLSFGFAVVVSFGVRLILDALAGPGADSIRLQLDL